MYEDREPEGPCHIIICHLIDKESKCKEYFRVSPNIFEYVLNFIKGDSEKEPYNRYKQPNCAQHYKVRKLYQL